MMQRHWRLWNTQRGTSITLMSVALAALLAITLLTSLGLAHTENTNPPVNHWDETAQAPVTPDATWDTCSQPIAYRTDATGTQLQLVTEAIQRLSRASGLAFEQGPPLDALPARTDRDLLIGFTDGTHPIFDTAPDAAGRARTAIINNHITGAVVAVRTDQHLTPGFGAGTTQGNMLLHELGHALGLHHSTDADSLMYPIINEQGDGYAPEDIRALQSATRVPATCP